jgi:hypothetical protein
VRLVKCLSISTSLLTMVGSPNKRRRHILRLAEAKVARTVELDSILESEPIDVSADFPSSSESDADDQLKTDGWCQEYCDGNSPVVDSAILTWKEGQEAISGRFMMELEGQRYLQGLQRSESVNNLWLVVKHSFLILNLTIPLHLSKILTMTLRVNCNLLMKR